jgi:hypothetical protein
MEDDTVRVVPTHDFDDILDLETITYVLMAHVPPDREMHFRLLQMKPGRRQQPEIASVIVMQMRDDDVLDEAGSTSSRRSASIGQRRKSRLRLAAVSAEKPRSMRNVRSGPTASQTK